jgi:hypothetical protein
MPFEVSIPLSFEALVQEAAAARLVTAEEAERLLQLALAYPLVAQAAFWRATEFLKAQANARRQPIAQSDQTIMQLSIAATYQRAQLGAGPGGRWAADPSRSGLNLVLDRLVLRIVNS